MRKLVTVGAGALARETIALVRKLSSDRPDIVGLVDDDPATHGTLVAGLPVLGSTEHVAELRRSNPDVQYVLCLGNPRRPDVRLRAARELGLPPSVYATLVHPDASLSGPVEVGPGSILLAGVIATADVRIGAHVVVMPGVVFTHDDVVEDGVTITAGVRLAGGVQVGAGAYLGSGALVREHVRIGAGAIVGMGAVVLDDVPAGEIWVGNPARLLRSVAT